MKITLIVILFSQFLFADIIGGKTVKEGEFNPVLKFSVGRYIYDQNSKTIQDSMMEGMGECSATRIAPRLILTAAHCFDNLTEFIALKEKSLGKRVPVFTQAPIQFEDSSIEVESYTPHPEYIRLLKENIVESDKLLTKLSLGEITKSTYNKEKDRLYNIVLTKIMKYDLAVIKTKTTSEEYYEVAFNKVYEHEPVQLVGFGKEMTFHEVEKSTKTLKRLLREVESATDEQVITEKLTKITKLQIKLEIYEKDSPKKSGVNVLHRNDWNQMYTTRGQAEQLIMDDTSKRNSGALGDSGMGLLIEESGVIKVSGVFSFYSSGEYQNEGKDYIYNYFSSAAIKSNQKFLQKQLPRH